MEPLVAAAKAALPDGEYAEAWQRGQRLAWRELLDLARTLAMKEPDAAAPDADQLSHSLSPREIEVLRLLVEGRSDREIGAALFISRHTASNHVAGILAKLGLPSRAAAAAYAVRHGLA
jgi:DNA-binding CsgD family transcriptional regulator